MNAQAMAPDGAGGGASRPIALSCRCAPHGIDTRDAQSSLLPVATRGRRVRAYAARRLSLFTRPLAPGSG